uniref:PUM-HD domain-containing protein n=1 Tax=Ananas comosus var. bracteatus TaxID=296719 RepID=A0A6V7P469_ANACO|nr:unnamed protein product [Ananas comosus var. bracteatus]
MAMENPVRLIGSSGGRSWPVSKDALGFNSSSSNLAGEELFQSSSDRIYDTWRNTIPNRSGSAPPTMEGSLAALSNLIGQRTTSFDSNFGNLSSSTANYEYEEQLRSDPAYVQHYLSKGNLNPRLPPPLISREGRRLMHQLGKVGNNWRAGSFDDSSKGHSFVSRSVLSTHKEESEDDRSPRLESSGHAADNVQFVSEQCMPGLEGHRNSLVDFVQDNFTRTPSPAYDNCSHPSNTDSTEETTASSCISPLQCSSLSMRSRSVESNTSSVSVRSHTPKPGRTTSVVGSGGTLVMQPGLSLKGKSNAVDGNFGNELGSVVSEMKNLKISSNEHNDHIKHMLFQQGSSVQVQGDHSQMNPHVAILDSLSQPHIKLSPVDIQPVMQSTGITAPLYTTSAYGNPFYPNLQPLGFYPPQYQIGGYALNAPFVPQVIPGYPPQSSVPMLLDNPLSPNITGRTSGFPVNSGNLTAGAELMQPYKFYGQFGIPTQPPIADPMYFQQPSFSAYPGASTMVPRASMMGNINDNFDPQKIPPSSATYSPDQRPHFPRSGSTNIPSGRKGGAFVPNHPGTTAYMGVLTQYPSASLSSPVYPGSPMPGTSYPGRRTDTMRLQPNSSRNVPSPSGWQGQRGREKLDDQKPCSFLDELKSNRTRRFELSDIAGRIVEFSADQHGSRFIQQKLENCSAEEKASVFQEVLPHASTLMTDVFGNYVIQKFFEHGSPDQRRELANKLVGQMLQLSLQMYGCRVIQKALEVIELDQKTQLVRELDGQVMRCVRDQNGNHVIQKCIECVPTDKIDFIISAFRGQVASLSTHPYGCRVIQRVLEHCTEDSQGQCIVDEILQSACTLAQDQYGNYVTQHVLQRGKPHERSQIISKLAGQVVQMSQNKFASNVIEKCLEHGDAAERELLIDEIVGQTEGNDNLLVMMKDQFANYVVQKILETCSDKQREVLLDRIRVHLPALRKYTYGKHIVARVEHIDGEGTDAAES